MFHSFRALHLRQFSLNRLRSALSVAGIAGAVALAVGVVGLTSSLNSAADSLVASLAGSADYEVEATSGGGLGLDVVADIADADGVALAGPMARTTVGIGGERVLLLGVSEESLRVLDPRLADVASSAIDVTDVVGMLTAQPELALGADLAGRLGARVGDSIEVLANGRTTDAIVTALIPQDRVEALDGGRAAIASLPAVWNMTGVAGVVDTVLVESDLGADPRFVRRSLEVAVADRGAVITPLERAADATAGLRSLTQSTFAIAAITLFVAGVLVLNTMTMAAMERRRELAALRAVGGRRRRLVSGFVGEAAILGVVGSVIGLVAGVGVGVGLVAQLPQSMAATTGTEIRYVFDPVVGAMALLLGIGLATLAAYLPARHVASVPPVEAMRPQGALEAGSEPTVRWMPLVLGTAITVSGLAVLVIVDQPPPLLGYGAMISLLMGPAILTNGVPVLIARLGASAVRPFGSTGRLAASALERSPRRVWATLTTMWIAAASVIGLGGATANIVATAGDSLAPVGDVDLLVQSGDPQGISLDPLPAEWADELRAIPGVASVSGEQYFLIRFGTGRLMGVAVTPDTRSPSVVGAGFDAQAAVHAGAGIIVSDSFVSSHGLTVGDRLDLQTELGMQSLEIVGTVPSPVWANGVITMSRPVAEELFDQTASSIYGVTYTDDADVAVVRAQIENLIADSPVQAWAIAGDEKLALVMGAIGDMSMLLNGMVAIIVFAAAFGILNTMIVSVMERRRELGILRAMGIRRRATASMVKTEAGAIVLLALGLGALVGIPLHYLIISVAPDLTGLPVDYAFGWTPLAMAAVATGFMGFIGAAAPARRAASVPIIEAIGFE